MVQSRKTTGKEVTGMTAQIISLDAHRQKRLNRPERHPLVEAGSKIWSRPCARCTVGDMVTVTLSHWALSQDRLTEELSAAAMAAVSRIESSAIENPETGQISTDLIKAKKQLRDVGEIAERLTEKMKPLAEIRIDGDQIRRDNSEARKRFAACLSALRGTSE